MPIVEAMNCHVPCITSNVSSMPEVAGSTGILVDPSNIDEISKAMYSIVFNKKLYNELKKNCMTRKKNFNWEKTANDVYQSMKKLHALNRI